MLDQQLINRLADRIKKFAARFPGEQTLRRIALNPDEAMALASEAVELLLTDEEIQLMALKKVVNRRRREDRQNKNVMTGSGVMPGSQAGMAPVSAPFEHVQKGFRESFEYALRQRGI